ncbi:MAG TPA: hypothetical protein VKP67_05020 [Xanthobacteraceae bacterium]|nr:hypothetical protein [Xanthobacteraceae bacterium]
MTKITINIDSETGIKFQSDDRGFISAATRKVGLLSSIDLTLLPELITAFESGFGMTVIKHLSGGYEPSALKGLKNDLRDNRGCKLITTVGGSVVFSAISEQGGDVPIVSLLGGLPQAGDSLTNLKGAVTLESYKSHAERIDYLVHRRQFDISNIYLYRNPNSNIRTPESNQWNQLTGSPNPMQIADFSGANQADKTNNIAGFISDLGNPADPQTPGSIATQLPNARVLVMSADPFFQENRDNLIASANVWLDQNNGRFVLYPLQDYQRSNTSLHARSACFGPDLRSAYFLLGLLARRVSDDPSNPPSNLGFYSVPNIAPP